MTFVPNNKFAIGRRVMITKEMSTIAGTFTKGHEFTIVGSGERGLDLKDDDGNCLFETGLSSQFIVPVEDY